MEPLPLDSILMFCRYRHHFSDLSLLQNPLCQPKILLVLLYRSTDLDSNCLIDCFNFYEYAKGEILIPGAQGIAFMALGICLFSPLSLLNQN